MNFLSFFKKETKIITKSNSVEEYNYNVKLLLNCNKFLDELISLIREKCANVYDIIPNKIEGVIFRISKSKVSLTEIEKFSIEEISNSVKFMREIYPSLKKMADDFINECEQISSNFEKNDEDFKIFLNSNCRFFVVEKLFETNSTEYYFAPILSSTINDDGSIDIKGLVTTSTHNTAYVEHFNSRTDVIRKMSKEEFEVYFLPDRVENMNFTSEKDIIEYVNFMRLTFKES